MCHFIGSYSLHGTFSCSSQTVFTGFVCTWWLSVTTRYNEARYTEVGAHFTLHLLVRPLFDHIVCMAHFAVPALHRLSSRVSLRGITKRAILRYVCIVKFTFHLSARLYSNREIIMLHSQTVFIGFICAKRLSVITRYNKARYCGI